MRRNFGRLAQRTLQLREHCRKQLTRCGCLTPARIDPETRGMVSMYTDNLFIVYIIDSCIVRWILRYNITAESNQVHIIHFIVYVCFLVYAFSLFNWCLEFINTSPLYDSIQYGFKMMH